jgi:hypothetical protein
MKAELEKRRELMIEYLKDKVILEDWHGVMDAAADIREIDAKLSVLGSENESDLALKDKLVPPMR